MLFFGFTDQTIDSKCFWLPPDDKKYPRYTLALKFKVILARPLRLFIPYFFKWKFLSDVRRLYLHDSKWNLRYYVVGVTHTKQLLNLLCIVYGRAKNWQKVAYLKRNPSPSVKWKTIAWMILQDVEVSWIAGITFSKRGSGVKIWQKLHF